MLKILLLVAAAIVLVLLVAGPRAHGSEAFSPGTVPACRAARSYPECESYCSCAVLGHHVFPNYPPAFENCQSACIALFTADHRG